MTKKHSLLPPSPKRVRPDMALAIVNVVLLLIMFFLATNALWNQSAPTEIRLSQTRDLPISQLPTPMLQIDLDDKMSLDGDPFPEAELGARLAELDRVYLLMDRTAPGRQLTSLLADPVFQDIDVVLVTIRQRNTQGAMP